MWCRCASRLAPAPLVLAPLLAPAPLALAPRLAPPPLLVPAPRLAHYKATTPKGRQGSLYSSLLLGLGAGLGLGAVYSYFNSSPSTKQSVILNPNQKKNAKILPSFPPVEISRKVVFPTDSSGLKLTLFQYPTCPFCCKVRAFLDYYRLSYDVVEVNPVLKQQLKWSKDYKKVPTLLVKVNNGYLQLNDSTMIISALSSYLVDKLTGIEKVSNYYSTIEYVDTDGSVKQEIFNRYFVMYQENNIPKGATKESMDDERKWRAWTDNVLVHTLSPNVYRTWSEALQAFNWFSQAGDWEKLFSWWERQMVIYVGALAMLLIGSRLKRKYNLKDDVRESLYSECEVWSREVERKGGEFHGGSNPDLADLAVYGVLTSIEGCLAFTDLLENTSLRPWYLSMKRALSD